MERGVIVFSAIIVKFVVESVATGCVLDAIEMTASGPNLALDRLDIQILTFE